MAGHLRPFADRRAARRVHLREPKHRVRMVVQGVAVVYAASSVSPTHRVIPAPPVTQVTVHGNDMTSDEEQRALTLARSGDRQAFGVA